MKVCSRDPEAPPMEYVKVSGGIFMDMMIHDFDMVRYLSGSDVTEVSATGACLVDPRFADYDDVDTAIVTLKFANGAIGVIDNCRQAPTAMTREWKYTARRAACRTTTPWRMWPMSAPTPG